MANVDLWTVVQHSGYGYAGKEGFARAVETRSVRTLTEKRLVESAGGLLFGTYVEASNFADNANYPEDAGLYPRVRGSFSEKKVDGLRVYIPVREVTG